MQALKVLIFYSFGINSLQERAYIYSHRCESGATDSYIVIIVLLSTLSVANTSCLSIGGRQARKSTNSRPTQEYTTLSSCDAAARWRCRETSVTRRRDFATLRDEPRQEG